MSLALPLASSQIRELFDVRDLVEATLPANRHMLPTFPQARLSAKRTLAATKGAKALHSICLRADGELWLVKFGSRGGWSCIWNFGAL